MYILLYLLHLRAATCQVAMMKYMTFILCIFSEHRHCIKTVKCHSTNLSKHISRFIAQEPGQGSFPHILKFAL